MLLSLDKRRQQRHLTAAFQYLKGTYKKDGENFLLRPVVRRQQAVVLNEKTVGLNWL